MSMLLPTHNSIPDPISYYRTPSAIDIVEWIGMHNCIYCTLGLGKDAANTLMQAAERGVGGEWWG